MTLAGSDVCVMEHVNKRYQTAEGSVSYEVEIECLTARSGERLALVAPSGSGKSTIMNMLLLAMSPDGAARHDLYMLDGQLIDISQLWQSNQIEKLSQLRARMMSFILQTGGLLPFLSARENIMLPSKIAGSKPDPQILEALIDCLSIGSVLSRKPASLSVGERQRVAVARALITRPRILIADEPTASLDRANAQAIMSLMLDLAKETGTCVILATHDLTIVDEFGFETLQYRHETAKEGHPKAVFWRAPEIGRGQLQ